MNRISLAFCPVILLLFIHPLNAQTNKSKIILYEDTAQFSSIEDVLKLPYFKDKVVYVDIWGTRCSPCIQEFNNLPELKKWYKGKPVVFLYLKSPYGFDDTKEWKEMVFKYNLEGVNVSMSINFYSNNFWRRYKNIYTEERAFEIPTYLIIDKQGKIINFDAPRPGDKQKLYKLLDEAYLKKDPLGVAYINGVTGDTLSKQDFDFLQQKDPRDIMAAKAGESAGITYYFYYSTKEMQKSHEDQIKLQGQPLPRFLLKDLTGNIVNSGTLRGKVVYINFWTTTCGPCRAEFPDLNKLKKKYKNDQVVLLSMAPESGEAIKKYLTKIPIDLKIIPNAEQIFKDWHIQAFPTHYFINKNGVVTRIQFGTKSEKNKRTGKMETVVFREFSALIDQMLKE